MRYKVNKSIIYNVVSVLGPGDVRPKLTPGLVRSRVAGRRLLFKDYL